MTIREAPTDELLSEISARLHRRIGSGTVCKAVAHARTTELAVELLARAVDADTEVRAS